MPGYPGPTGQPTRRTVSSLSRRRLKSIDPLSAAYEERPEFTFADRPADFSECKKRYQGDKLDRAPGQYCLHASTASGWKALSNAPAPYQSDYYLFDDVKADKKDRKYKRLIQNRVGKRLMFELPSQMQILANEQYLCQD